MMKTLSAFIFDFKNRFLILFILLHAIFSIFLGRIYAFAPDERAYLYTFNNLYGNTGDPNPQYGSGWIAAPKIFLWILHLPAKILTLIGVPDIFALRFLSIGAIATALLILIAIDTRKNNRVNSKRIPLIFFFFFIPSVFLWTSIGLREAFIICEMCLIIGGIFYFGVGQRLLSGSMLLIGSYGLVSTKSYIWMVFVVSLAISLTLKTLTRNLSMLTSLRLISFAVVLPIFLFTATASIYALNFALNSSISKVGERSGDSISQFFVTNSEVNSEVNSGKLLTFHGDGTIISLHQYIINNPDSTLTKVLRLFQIDRYIQEIWKEKIRQGLSDSQNEVRIDSTGTNSYIVKPGRLSDPQSVLSASWRFVFGPIPFIDSSSVGIQIISFESVFWWLLYMYIFFLIFMRLRHKAVFELNDIFCIVFLSGLIFMSALIEVNLGTSIRHKSILLAPLIYLGISLSRTRKS